MMVILVMMVMMVMMMMTMMMMQMMMLKMTNMTTKQVFYNTISAAEDKIVVQKDFVIETRKEDQIDFC